MTHSFEFISQHPDETIQLGKRLAKYLRRGDIVCLEGDLGTGKTTLTKGIAQGLRVTSEYIHSPTFVLMNIYEGKIPLYHFDFYRLEDPHQIAAIGYEEFLYGRGVAVIEWAERLGELTPQARLEVKISHQGENSRKFEFFARGDRYQQLLKMVL
ncbi:MAG: tRNA (adenosine(37)-N6)-threonylcarbamoyltransferase complex ATPase subunit type 1 TsaE [Candidatus Omnitrophica bacterium]|nr:tRNA (adenosine(37)-N6)-threonylcarbamoyltransferase complex ATPase subunit type 1 TsaE [Candidatus Omnitrophota bacterium]